MEGRLFGMKTHLLGNVGKGPRQFQQGQAGFLFSGGCLLLLSHGRMTRGASTLFLLPGQSSPLTGILFCPMIGIGVRPLFFGGTRQFFPPLQFSVLSLVGSFPMNVFQNLGVCGGRGRVPLSGSTGFGLYFVQPGDFFLTGRFLFDAHHVWVERGSNCRTWRATLSTAPTPGLFSVSRLFPLEIRNRSTLGLFAHPVRKTCLL